MSLLGAFIASITALTISVIIFPWQKTIDRQSEYMKERRLLYREYIGSASTMFAAIRSREVRELNIALARHSNFAAQILLVSSPPLTTKVRELDSQWLKIITLAKGDIERGEVVDYSAATETISLLFSEIALLMREEIDAIEAKSPDLRSYVTAIFQRRA